MEIVRLSAKEGLLMQRLTTVFTLGLAVFAVLPRTPGLVAAQEWADSFEDYPEGSGPCDYQPPLELEC
jgi:hypothetical protein